MFKRVVVVAVAALAVSCRGDSLNDLQQAIKAGDTSTIGEFVRSGSNPNGNNHGVSYVEFAIANNRFDSFSALVRSGADPRTKIRDIDVFFVVAASGERCTREAIDALLKAGRSPNELDEGLGSTPLHESLSSGANECASALLDAGADPRAIDRSGATTLHSAAIGASRGVIARLLSATDQIDARWRGDLTPLMLAAQRQPSDPEADGAVELLLSSGADACLLSRSGTSIGEMADVVGAPRRAMLLKQACADKTGNRRP